jgi:ABC-type polysaccharide/polyol phosphate transport system ATPase subunit
MSRDGSIVVDNVWKRFRSDDDSGLALAEMRRWNARRRGDVTTGWRWVLQSISFEIAAGETVGLLGINGSGKSTLLKIIASMMFPSIGTVRATGTIGSLIDVRAGLHPELTGRENIYLYLKMLGVDDTRIDARFDEIVEFAGIADALDRQVKHFSSGMALRLGFAVVSHSDPDILIVDEALAVGDAVFRQRCLEHIAKSAAEGTTLLYVSHDLETVETACTRTIWIHDSAIVSDGSTNAVLDQYRAFLATTMATTPTHPAHRLTSG